VTRPAAAPLALEAAQTHEDGGDILLAAGGSGGTEEDQRLAQGFSRLIRSASLQEKQAHVGEDPPLLDVVSFSFENLESRPESGESLRIVPHVVKDAGQGLEGAGLALAVAKVAHSFEGRADAAQAAEES